MADNTSAWANFGNQLKNGFLNTNLTGVPGSSLNDIGNEITNGASPFNQFVGGLFGQNTNTGTPAKLNQPWTTADQNLFNKTALPANTPYGQNKVDNSQSINGIQSLMNQIDSAMNSGGSFTPTQLNVTDNLGGYLQGIQQMNAPAMQALGQAYYGTGTAANPNGGILGAMQDYAKTVPQAFQIEGQGLQNEANTLSSNTKAQIAANNQIGQATANQINTNNANQSQNINRQENDAKLQLGAFAKTHGITGGDPFIEAEKSAAGQPYAQALTQLNQSTMAQLGSLAANITGQNTSLQGATNEQLAKIGTQIAMLAPQQAQAIAQINTSIGQTLAQLASGEMSANDGMLKLANDMNAKQQQTQIAAYTAVNNARYQSAEAANQAQANKIAGFGAKMKGLMDKYNMENPPIQTATNNGTTYFFNNNGPIGQANPNFRGFWNGSTYTPAG